MAVVTELAMERDRDYSFSACSVLNVDSSYTEHGARVDALRGVSLEINRGEIVGLIGPSGCGKSTLLEIIAGLIDPDAGSVALSGVPTPTRERLGCLGYMKQRDLLLPWLTITDNVALGLEVRGVARAEARGRAMTQLAEVGLKEFCGRYPAELSGGMRQRAAFARTWVMDQPLVLLDEPFGALDAITRRDLQRWLAEQWLQKRPAMLLVTHDIDEALFLADRVAVMSARPGAIQAVVTNPLPRADRDATLVNEDLRRLRSQVVTMLEAGVAR